MRRFGHAVASLQKRRDFFSFEGWIGCCSLEEKTIYFNNILDAVLQNPIAMHVELDSAWKRG